MFDKLLYLAGSLNAEVFYEKSIIGKSYLVEVNKELYCINLDKSRIENQNDLNVCLAHELGHLQSGTLYYNNATKLYKGSAEYRADYRAAQLVMPINELKECIQKGITEIYELAEFFSLTEEYVNRALYIYEKKGLLQELVITL